MKAIQITQLSIGKTRRDEATLKATSDNLAIKLKSDAKHERVCAMCVFCVCVCVCVFLVVCGCLCDGLFGFEVLGRGRGESCYVFNFSFIYFFIVFFSHFQCM